VSEPAVRPRTSVASACRSPNDRPRPETIEGRCSAEHARRPFLCGLVTHTFSVAGAILREMPADAYPHLTEHALKPGYDYAEEFTFGLALILDALRPDEVVSA
jgi:hypothetical protein